MTSGRTIGNLVDISGDAARYVKGLCVDYIEGDVVHLISEDGNWEVNFDWKEFILDIISTVREYDEREKSLGRFTKVRENK